MTAPSSTDLRERALARKAAGETNRQIAAALQISSSCVSKWTKRRRETGSLAPALEGPPGQIAPERLVFVDEPKDGAARHG